MAIAYATPPKPVWDTQLKTRAEEMNQIDAIYSHVGH